MIDLIQAAGQVPNIGIDWSFSGWTFVQFIVLIGGIITFFLKQKAKIDRLEETNNDMKRQLTTITTSFDRKIKEVVNDTLGNEKNYLTQEFKNSQLELRNHFDSKINDFLLTLTNVTNTTDTLKINVAVLNKIIEKHEGNINEIYKDYMPKFKKEIVYEIKEYIDHSNNNLKELISTLNVKN